MKKFWSVVLAVAVDSIIPGRLKIHAIPYPPTRGINTPISAMIKDAFPVLFNSTDIGFKSGTEHQNDNTDFRNLMNKFGLF